MISQPSIRSDRKKKTTTLSWLRSLLDDPKPTRFVALRTEVFFVFRKLVAPTACEFPRNGFMPICV